MELTYKNIKEISQERLVDLFKSVEWELLMFIMF